MEGEEDETIIGRDFYNGRPNLRGPSMDEKKESYANEPMYDSLLNSKVKGPVLLVNSLPVRLLDDVLLHLERALFGRLPYFSASSFGFHHFKTAPSDIPLPDARQGGHSAPPTFLLQWREK